MRILVEGSGGVSGWPEPGCRCASCLRQAAAGNARRRSTVVVDDIVRIEVGDAGATWSGDGDAGGARSGDGNAGGARSGDGDAGGARSGDGDAGGARSAEEDGSGGKRGWEAAGYRVVRVADREEGGSGGWDLTAPDGRRLLYAGGPGAVPAPPEGTAAYDAAFLDLLGDPAQLGWLRARGLITAGTDTRVAFADHRVASEAELARRCGFWRVGRGGDGDVVSLPRSVLKDLDLGAGTRRVLVLGGARSGKSERAELRLAGEPEVTYVASGSDGAGDPEWAARVAAHRARRPAWWRTAETTGLASVLRTARGAVLIDGIGTWLAAVMDECGAWDGGPAGLARLAARTAGLVGAWRQADGYVVAVSDETGLGVVPATPAGRLFRDQLGRLNRALAAESEETELVVAGRVLSLDDL
jgi:adenosylcobinamide kinase / adenosylcobinamide-phosphate guanylyltransferase